MTTWTVQAEVIRVHDGDTFAAHMSLGWNVWIRDRLVRLAGIDAPELAYPAGPAAQQALLALLPVGSVVTLMSHSLDKYGRALASITLADGRDAAGVMIAEGFALPWDGTGPKPWPPPPPPPVTGA